MAKAKKKENVKQEIPEEYTLIAADLSLKRPGFCMMSVNTTDGTKSINKIAIISVDNKTKVKPRGMLLTEIAAAFSKFISKTSGAVFFVREKSINNCMGKMARSGTAARTGVSEVVGIMDYMAWQKNESEWDEIYPVSIKKLLTGNGKAEKHEVAEALNAYLGEIDFKNDDESDAVAVGIAWLIQNNQIKQHIQEEHISE